MKRFLLLGILMLISSYGFSQTISKPARVLSIVCKDTEQPISFSISGSFDNASIFKVLLSDDENDFSVPIELGEISYINGQTDYGETFSLLGISVDKYYIKVVSTVTVAQSPVSDPFSVVINDPIDVSPNGPTEFCDGGSVLLVNNADSRIFEWFKEGTPAVSQGFHRELEITTTGRYYAVNELGGCTETSDVFEITVTHTPTSSIVDEFNVPEIDRDVCAPDAYKFYAETSDASLDNPYFEWLNASDVVVGTGVSFETAIAGTYRLRTTNYGNLSPGGGCPTVSDAVTLTVHDFEAIIEETSPLRNCEGTPQVLTSSEKNPNYTYRWFKGSNEITGLVQPAIEYILPSVKTSNGNYTLVVESPACNKTSEIVKVTFVPTPVSIIDPAIDKELCRGDLYSLTQASTNLFGVVKYQWFKEGVAITDISDTNTTLNIDTSGDEAGDYEYTLVTYNGNELCSAISDPVIITVHDFVAEIIETGPMEICSGEEVTLTSREQNPNYTYNWKKGGVTLPPPISGVGKTTYTFTSAEASSGDYTLEIISPACTKESSPALSILVKDSPLPIIVIDANESLKGCNGTSVTLKSGVDDSANEFTYQWFKEGFAIPGATSKTLAIVIGTNTEGNYYYEMTFGSCNVASDPVLVMLVPEPTSSILEGAEVIACEGEEAVLNADSDLNGSEPANVVYEWIDASDAVVGTGDEFRTTTAGEYRLVTKNEGVCGNTSPVTTVIISKKANSLISYTVLADCEKVTLTANSDLQLEDPARVVYVWYKNDVEDQRGISDTYNVYESGDYKLETLNYGLCSGTTDQVAVTINDLDPSIDEPVSPVKVCVGNSHTLRAVVSDVTFTYIWYKNTVEVQSGHSPEYNISTAVGDIGDWSYTLHVFDPASNCGKDSAPVIVEINNSPEAIITNGNIDACETDDVIVLVSKDTDAFYDYKWFKDGVEIGDSTRSELVVNILDNANTDTKYKLEVSYGESCTETSTEITIHKVKTPQAVVTSSGETTVCDDSTVLLESASIDKEEPTTYRWFKVVDGIDVLIPGANQWQYDAQATGEYKIEVTNKGICSDLSDPISVIITPSVEAVISPNVDQYVCDNVPFSSVNSVNVIIGVTTFQWYRIVDGVEEAIPFATEETYNAKEEGDYFFEAFNHGVCGSRSEVVNVKFTQFEHEIEEAPLVKECEGHEIILHSINTDTENYQFTWFKEGSTDIIGKGLTYTVNGDLSESGNYILEVSEKGATCVKPSEPVTVVILPDPVSNINLGGGFNCEGAVVTLNSEESNRYYDYTWYFNDNEILEDDANYENVNSPRLDVTMVSETEGVYTVKVSIGSCDSGMSNAVMLDMYDLEPELDVDPGMVLCRDGSVALTAITNNNDDVKKYRWFRDGNPITGETLETTIVDHIGRYKAEVTSRNSGCVQFTDEVDITLVPSMGVVEDTIYSNSGVSVTFEAYGGDSYVWFDADGDIVQTGGDTFTVDNVQGNLAYQVKISNGYCDELFDLLIVSGEITADDIQNLMTPNGDGFNDTWKLPPGFVVSGDEVIILNRQGTEVYRSNNYKDDWRGTFNDGPALPAATYYYVIKRIGKEPIMGSVTIFR